jgi:hypothetical protein
MGGPVGAMSTKLVLKAGMLLFAARLDGHAATATIDPAAAETIIAPKLAAHLKLAASGDSDTEVRRFHVIGVDHTELRLRRVLVRSVTGPAAIVIGQDLLAQMRIRLDFDRGRLRVLDPSDRARIGEGEAIVPLKRAAGGCLELAVPDGSEHVVLAAPAGDSANASPSTPMQVGDFKLATFDAKSSGSCSSATKLVTWASFRAMRIMIDLPHERMILAKDHGS